MTANKRKPLTGDLQVKKAKCEEGRRVTRYSCGGLGLFLDVKSGGASSFVLCIMVKGKRIERGLGSYPLVKLAEAQEKATAFARKLRDGDEVGAKAAKAEIAKGRSWCRTSMA